MVVKEVEPQNIQNASIPSHIAYYISSHGYGHATRAIQICHAFISFYSELKITIVSQAGSQIFLPLLNSSDRVNLRPVKTDSTVLQPTPWLLDVENTVANLIQLHQEQEEIISIESEWIDSHNVDFVIADAPYIPCIAAARAGRLSMLITNFSFAEVFSYFTSMVNNEQKPALERAVEAIIDGYSHADVWLRLPGWLPNPGFLSVNLPSTHWIQQERLSIKPSQITPYPEVSKQNSKFNRQIIDTPLITRPATQISRSELLTNLQIPSTFQNSKLLLQLLPLPDPVPILPPGWICLVAGSTPTQFLPERYYIAPPDIHIPDAMKIASCVMAKLGYGLSSEVLASGAPLVYVPRRQFVEEYGLRRLVETWKGYGNKASRLEIDDYEKGIWWDKVNEVEGRSRSTDGEKGEVDFGDKIRDLAVDRWISWSRNKLNS